MLKPAALLTVSQNGYQKMERPNAEMPLKKNNLLWHTMNCCFHLSDRTSQIINQPYDNSMDNRCFCSFIGFDRYKTVFAA